VLFVCVENACRSQIAEAFARQYGQDRITAYSAGSRPRGQVDTQATAVMKERGLDLSHHASKGLSDLPQVTWDAIVTMGCGEACPTLPAKQRLDWRIPDPARQPPEVYRQVRDAIEGAVKTLIEQLTAG
jgi:protein-tyrosine-phosphatase